MNVVALILPTSLYARDPHSLALTAILYSSLYRLIFYFSGMIKGFVLPDNLYQANKTSGRFVGGLIAHGPALLMASSYPPHFSQEALKRAK